MSLKIFDLAGSQRECMSYHPGHTVHWIQYFKSVDAPRVIPVAAAIDDDGFLRLQWEDSSLENWNHDPVALGSALRRAGGRAVWKPRWHVLVEIAHDYRGRILYELLQNADDAMGSDATGAGGDSDAIVLRLTDTDLWVGNSGPPTGSFSCPLTIRHRLV